MLLSIEALFLFQLVGVFFSVGEAELRIGFTQAQLKAHLANYDCAVSIGDEWTCGRKFCRSLFRQILSAQARQEGTRHISNPSLAVTRTVFLDFVIPGAGVARHTAAWARVCIPSCGRSKPEQLSHTIFLSLVIREVLPTSRS